MRHRVVSHLPRSARGDAFGGADRVGEGLRPPPPRRRRVPSGPSGASARPGGSSLRAGCRAGPVAAPARAGTPGAQHPAGPKAQDTDRWPEHGRAPYRLPTGGPARLRGRCPSGATRRTAGHAYGNPSGPRCAGAADQPLRAGRMSVPQLSAAGLGCWPRLLASAAGLGCWPRLLASAAGLGCWPRLLASAAGLGRASASVRSPGGGPEGRRPACRASASGCSGPGRQRRIGVR